MFWATHWAKRMPVGSQLGLSEWAEMEWISQRSLQWPDPLPFLFEKRHGAVPHVLLLHLGGNDIGLMKYKALLIQVLADL